MIGVPCSDGSKSTRPQRLLRGLAFSLALVVTLLLPQAPLRADEPASSFASRGRAYSGWLTSSGLSSSGLQVVALHLTSQADDPEQTRPVLELRWTPVKRDEGATLQALSKQWQEFARVHHRGLPETLFYKMMQITGATRSQALVTVFVGAESVDIYHDPTSKRIVVAPGTKRQARLPFSFESLAGTNEGALIQGDAVPKRVIALLKQYFVRANQTAHLKPPAFSGERTEEDYAGLVVEGVRGDTSSEKGLWQRLEVNVELRPAVKGRRSIVYLLGKHAAGLGTSLPGEYPEDIPDAILEQLALRLRAALESSGSATQ